MREAELEELEIDLLLEAIFRRYGYDFRSYARASLKRRVTRRQRFSQKEHIADLIAQVLHDESTFEVLLKDLSISVTEMFRDPGFYLALRKQVIPVLETYPFLKIWHAGCATGEEVYSMAILLREEGLLERAQIYATDFNTASLETAQRGVYPAAPLREYTANYNRAGGKASLSDYYHAAYGSVKIHDRLRKKITFAYHNLVTDRVFGEMNLIVCRNVMIYFDRSLQDRVLTLFDESLCRRGFLALGSKETVATSAACDRFATVAPEQKIYRRVD